MKNNAIFLSEMITLLKELEVLISENTTALDKITLLRICIEGVAVSENQEVSYFT